MRPFFLLSQYQTENLLLLAERFGTLFLIGLLTHLPHGDVTIEGNKLHPTKNRLKFPTVFTLKGHFHNFHNFIVLFQPHSVGLELTLNRRLD